MWESRSAVLSLLALYVHASPEVQRLAVRKGKAVAVLFGLLWEGRTQKLALDMVSSCSLCCITSHESCVQRPGKKSCRAWHSCEPLF